MLEDEPAHEFETPSAPKKMFYEPLPPITQKSETKHPMFKRHQFKPKEPGFPQLCSQNVSLGVQKMLTTDFNNNDNIIFMS